MGQSCNMPYGVDMAPRNRGLKEAQAERPYVAQHDEIQVPKPQRTCHICYICVPPWGSWAESDKAAENRFEAAAPRH
eukprot:CAMPEP_0171100046 /NCGR_PEP_ID=MMETSP0766_2-20121228/52721_1 /TAXON_ID=439317 /ORGANISM="Gambierdiscus australes, Strain CAWD 149" /LENGTH=76 /DNA_ID=CAMNT_0011559795 /DNA_START=47 /DNA_END=277 /DNA_ORIENTATION=+